MLLSHIAYLVSLCLYGSLFVSAAIIPLASREIEPNYVALTARGNSISLYKSFSADLAALEKAEQEENKTEAAKFQKKLQEGLEKQQKSIDKLTDKTDKELEASMEEAEKIRLKIEAADEYFHKWIAKLNKKDYSKGKPT